MTHTVGTGSGSPCPPHERDYPVNASKLQYAQVLCEHGQWSVMFLPTRPQDPYPYALLDGFGIITEWHRTWLSAAKKARELDQQDRKG